MDGVARTHLFQSWKIRKTSLAWAGLVLVVTHVLQRFLGRSFGSKLWSIFQVNEPAINTSFINGMDDDGYLTIVKLFEGTSVLIAYTINLIQNSMEDD